MVDGVSIDDSDGWWLECSKSITRENRERLPPPPPQKKSNLFFIFWSIYSFFFKCFVFNWLTFFIFYFVFWDGFCGFHPFLIFYFVLYFFIS